jgi:hypothetical protein
MDREGAKSLIGRPCQSAGANSGELLEAACAFSRLMARSGLTCYEKAIVDTHCLIEAAVRSQVRVKKGTSEIFR